VEAILDDRSPVEGSQALACMHEGARRACRAPKGICVR